MLTVKEINTYINLSKRGFVQKITCPFDSSDAIVTKVNDDLEPFFYCLNCNSTFIPGGNTENRIRESINKIKSLRD